MPSGGIGLLAPENEKSCYLLPSAPISHLVLVCLFLYQRLDCRAGALPTRGSAHPLVLLNTSHIKRPPSNWHFALVAASGFLHQRPSASSPGLSFFVTAGFYPCLCSMHPRTDTPPALLQTRHIREVPLCGVLVWWHAMGVCTCRQALGSGQAGLPSA